MQRISNESRYHLLVLYLPHSLFLALSKKPFYYLVDIHQITIQIQSLFITLVSNNGIQCLSCSKLWYFCSSILDDSNKAKSCILRNSMLAYQIQNVMS